MASISAFTINAKAEEEGAWVRPGEEYDDLDIKTRGFTFAYRDSLANKMRRAAISLGGDTDKVPSAIKHAHVVESLIAHCLQDVRNLSNVDGSPMTFADFCDKLRDPRYRDLLTASLKAAGMVGIIGAANVEDAAGN